MANGTERRFDAAYHEDKTLSDGTRVRFRLVRAEDKERILTGLRRMSPESRYLRFFAHRDNLSPHELAYLTEIDQENHFALGVGYLGAEDAEGAGLGVARFVRDAAHPGRAEAAVAVVDEAQGKGLGRALFKRLVEAAKERGVREFELTILADNDAMLGLLQSIFPGAEARPQEGVVAVVCPLPDVTLERPEQRPEGPLYRLLGLAAEGIVQVIRRAWSWPVPPDFTDGILGGESSARLVDDERE